MKKLLLYVGAVAGVVFLGKRGRLDFERLVERMPEDVPPKWMFRNIEGIRQNTERILQLLEDETPRPAGRSAQDAV